MTLRIETVGAGAIGRHLADVARLRIEVFRAFPYLYAGSVEYEERYLAALAASPGSVVVLAFDGDEIVGASTGLPLVHETAEVQRPFVDRRDEFDVGRIFYFGESVLRAAYRGRGIGVAFFDAREAHARAVVAGLTHTTFCAVERTVDHPRRPADYEPLDAFWRRRGYTHRPDLRTTFDWQDLDEDAESPKPMSFWLRGWT